MEEEGKEGKEAARFAACTTRHHWHRHQHQHHVNTDTGIHLSIALIPFLFHSVLLLSPPSLRTVFSR